MKIAVIGGAGVRTPLLVNGLTQSDLPIEEIGLYDIDRQRLGVIAPLAASFSPVVRPYDDARACVAGASFVILSIRVGGIAARARDESVTIAHDIVGQETVGPGGFAMAMRACPPVVDYARLVEREAPRAWVINFTNPVGIVTQAMTAASKARVIGICDTPTELFEDVAHLLGVESSRCFFDYFGLNHLGWLREVYYEGEPHVARGAREHQESGADPGPRHRGAERSAVPRARRRRRRSAAGLPALPRGAQRRLHADRVGRGRAGRARAMGRADRLRQDRACRRALHLFQLERDHSAQRVQSRRAPRSRRG